MLPNKIHNIAKKDIPLVLRGQLGLQRADGRFYLLVEIGRARLFDILLWSSELAAKRSVFRSKKAARASSWYLERESELPAS